MKNGVQVTLVGWAGSTPKQVVGDGVPFSSFRVAVSERRYDSRSGEWVDGKTEWFTVKAFRDLAFNVAASVRSSDPVVVTGRLRTEEWVSPEGTRHSLVVDADSVGHDLSRGTAVFARTVRRGSGGAETEPLTAEAVEGMVADLHQVDDVAGALAGSETDPWATADDETTSNTP